MKHWLSLLYIGLLGFSLSTWAENPRVEFETSEGNFSVELYADQAPKTVDNFLRYVRNGFYNGTTFHRVIPDFMVQGGGYTKSYRKKTTRGPISNEADNGLLNERGTIAMARLGDPHSATSQFFINMADNDMLDYQGKTRRNWGYAVFGRVIEGMDVLETMQDVETGPAGPFKKNAPQTPLVIKKVTVLDEDAVAEETGAEETETEKAAVEDAVVEAAADDEPEVAAKKTPPKAAMKPSATKVNKNLSAEVEKAAGAEANPSIDPYGLYEPEPPDVPAVP
jgi:cyclophilin family peptidyl-prolyl cis-trans isomerase